MGPRSSQRLTLQLHPFPSIICTHPFPAPACTQPPTPQHLPRSFLLASQALSIPCSDKGGYQQPCLAGSNRSGFQPYSAPFRAFPTPHPTPPPALRLSSVGYCWVPLCPLANNLHCIKSTGSHLQCQINLIDESMLLLHMLL